MLVCSGGQKTCSSLTNMLDMRWYEHGKAMRKHFKRLFCTIEGYLKCTGGYTMQNLCTKTIKKYQTEWVHWVQELGIPSPSCLCPWRTRAPKECLEHWESWRVATEIRHRQGWQDGRNSWKCHGTGISTPTFLFVPFKMLFQRMMLVLVAFKFAVL